MNDHDDSRSGEIDQPELKEPLNEEPQVQETDIDLFNRLNEKENLECKLKDSFFLLKITIITMYNHVYLIFKLIGT